MKFDELVYRRFSSMPYFEEVLAKYAGRPAAFYQTAPDDKQEGWGEEQYPRIVYTIDMQADQERKSAGVMQVDLFCDESKSIPEDIEPHIRECFKNLIVKPEGNSHYAFAWARTELFDLEKSGRDRGVGTRIAGASIRFDILEYSRQETSNPDPAKGLQHWLKKLEPTCLVVGEDHIETFYEPSGIRPAFYVRVQSYKTNRVTYAVTWMDCVLAVHVIAPEPENRNRWTRWIADQLNLAGEVILLDESPMFLDETAVDMTSDYLTRGQITVKAQYSIPRFQRVQHPLSQLNINEKEER